MIECRIGLAGSAAAQVADSQSIVEQPRGSLGQLGKQRFAVGRSGQVPEEDVAGVAVAPPGPEVVAGVTVWRSEGPAGATFERLGDAREHVQDITHLRRGLHTPSPRPHHRGVGDTGPAVRDPEIRHGRLWDVAADAVTDLVAVARKPLCRRPAGVGAGVQERRTEQYRGSSQREVEICARRLGGGPEVV